MQNKRGVAGGIESGIARRSATLDRDTKIVIAYRRLTGCWMNTTDEIQAIQWLQKIGAKPNLPAPGNSPSQIISKAMSASGTPISPTQIRRIIARHIKS
jgi:hypothetical protein